MTASGIRLMLIALAICLSSVVAFSATVDWGNKEGIGAIYTVDGGSAATTRVAVLGTDGNIYVMSDPEHWKKIEVTWPVPLKEIAEWMPGLPNAANYGYCLIKTTSGKWWTYKAIRKDNGDWSRKWTVLTLEDIIADR